MININGKEYRNIQEQVEKNKEDIEDLQDNTVTKQYVDNSVSAVYGNVYTRDQADDRFPTETHMNLLLGYKQDKLTAGTNITIDENNVISATGGSTYTAGDNIVIDSSNKISVAATPTFENVIIDNDSYASNFFQGKVIEYNESGDNNEGHIIMSGNCPELYSYNDHLHGEYGNDSKLQMLEDIKVTKTGYSNYPNGYYTKSYDLIDTLEGHTNSIANLEAKTLPTYGIEPTVTNISDFANMDFADLVAAGLPILGSYDYKSTDPYPTIDLPKGEYCNVKGMFALRKQQSQAMPFYIIYVIGDWQGTTGAWVSYNKAQMYKSSHRTGLVLNTRIRNRLGIQWTNAPDQYSTEIPVVFLTPAGVGNVQISAENADKTYSNVKSMQLPLVIPHPGIDVRYDNQLAIPTSNGTYSLKVTVSDGLTTLAWVAENNNQ